MQISSPILAINMYKGIYITYSADPDIYKFRVMKYNETTFYWNDYQYGPEVNRLNELVYFCTSITYVTNHNSDMIVVTEIIKYNGTLGHTFDIKITEMRMFKDEMEVIPDIAWEESKSMLEKKMKLDKGVDIFSKQIYQNQMATVSHRSENNFFFTIFGEHILAL